MKHFTFSLHYYNADITVNVNFIDKNDIIVKSVNIGKMTKNFIATGYGHLRTHSAIMKLQRKMEAYFNGEMIDFSLISVDSTGMTPFQKNVLSALRTIPYGVQISYSQLAKISGFPKAIRATASVVRKNYVPIIIPCHRIIRKSGEIGKYCGSDDSFYTHVKTALLSMEHITLDKK